MSGPFSAMDVSATGVGFSQFWINTISHNIANVNTVTSTDQVPFKSFQVVARERIDGDLARPGSGVEVAAVPRQDMENPIVWDPDHPLADEDGVVVLPAVDIAVQMSDLIIAQRSLQANVRALRSAEEAYRSALAIGSSR